MLKGFEHDVSYIHIEAMDSFNSTSSSESIVTDGSPPAATEAAAAMMTGANIVYISEAYIQPIIFGIGLATNIVNLFVLNRVRIMDHFRVALIALAISDLFATGFGLLQITLEVAHFGGDIPFGYWHPKAILNFALYYLGFLVFMATSATIVILIAIIRNLMVTQPLRSKKLVTPGRIRIMCLVTFFVTFAIFLPTIVNILYQGCFKEHNLNNTNATVCVQLYETLPNVKTVANDYVFVLNIVYGPGFLLIYIICFIIIRVTLNRSAKFLYSFSTRKDSQVKALKKRGRQVARFTRTLLVILILDTICTIPSIIFNFGLVVAPESFIFNKDNQAGSILDVLTEILLIMRPVYNFWVYVFTQRDFRTQWLRMMHVTSWHKICSCLNLRPIDIDTEPTSPEIDLSSTGSEPFIMTNGVNLKGSKANGSPGTRL